MDVEELARRLCRRGGELIVAVVDCGDKMVPICRDPAAMGLAVVALLQSLAEHPAFARDREAVDRFLVDFGVGRYKDVKLSGPKGL